MDPKTGQHTCECGKQFNSRNDLEKHRETCATAQAAGSKTRTAGGGPEGNR